MTTRADFLKRVRMAVGKGNKPGDAVPLPARGDCGYQGAGDDIVGRFVAELTAAGGIAYKVADTSAAREEVLRIVLEKRPSRALLGSGPVVESLGLASHLRSQGIEVHEQTALTTATAKADLFAADLSITGMDFLIAETGSLVHVSRPSHPRSLSLLPPVHVVVASADQLLPDLFDLFERLQQPGEAAPDLPSSVTLITGPSKTGDIELRLVTGVHGPAELHAILF
jgi:L-lactate utilization protein LutC